MITDKIGNNFLEGDKNPFLVPPGYFEKSRSQIMGLIANEESKTPIRKLSIRNRLMWISGVAASLLLGLTLVQKLVIKPGSVDKIAQEIEWFINSSGPDLDMGTLASYYMEEGINFEEMNDETIDIESSSLLELTDYDELFIIEEWMKSEKK